MSILITRIYNGSLFEHRVSYRFKAIHIFDPFLIESLFNDGLYFSLIARSFMIFTRYLVSRSEHMIVENNFFGWNKQNDKTSSLVP